MCPETYDWSHIYKCFQETQKQDRGFAEFCFLCSDWFFDTESWELHYQDHVNDLENFPVFLDPLVFNGVLAMPGFCYNCLVDPRLPASKRMYQFKSKPKWQSHIQRHIDALGEQPVKCEFRTQQCSFPFNSTLELQFYLQDAHGIHSLKKLRTRKRRNNQTEGRSFSQLKKTQLTGQSKADIKSETVKEQTALLEYTFVNASIKSVEIATAFKSASKSSSRTPSLPVSTASSSCGRRGSGSQTPLSSVCDDIRNGPDSASYKELYVNDDDFVTIESLEGGSVHQSGDASSWHQQGLSLKLHHLTSNPNNFKDTMDMEENMYDLASTAHMYYQLGRQCCSLVDPPLAIENLTFIDLTGDDDVDQWTHGHSDYQELVPSSVPDDVDVCHRVTLCERSVSVLHAPINPARQQVNDAAIVPSERKSHNILALSQLISSR